MNPLGSDIQVDIPLTLVQDAYVQGANDFIADQVFPMIGVQKRVGNCDSVQTISLKNCRTI